MQKKVSMRKCIGCLESKPKQELIRIVKDNKNNIFYDKTSKANGRGAYICHNEECFDKAIKQHKFQKEFGIQFSEELFENLRRDIFTNG